MGIKSVISLMFLSISYNFLTLMFTLSSCHTIERQYECGQNGRFEYCVEDIPGCVIGCHCHPGYYFDTDTKICEPNIKLTQGFRRHYLSDLSASALSNTPPPINPTPTATPQTSILDKKVDEIANDTSDLGDWLYNQFFKTIETQVINETNSEIPNKLTRRNGSSPAPKKIKRKRRKSWKDGKKRKSKARGLRRKLLRITEDDSLFQSDSSSRDESSASSDSNSDTSSESDSSKGDRDHGHKKIIMFNKKLRPPLPSFIFLPHMDTPYYPPIGLPPPPALPMYPIIPIPPMAPVVPFPSPPAHTNEEKSSITSTTSAPATTLMTTSESQLVTTISTDIGVTSDIISLDQTADTVKSERSRLNQRHKKKPIRKQEKSENSFGTEFAEESRHKLINKLREKLKRRNKMPPDEEFMKAVHDEESPYMDDLPFSRESYLFAKQIQQRAMKDGVPNMKNVDFKYLSQLIHRANLNNTNKVPPHPLPQNENTNDMIDIGQTGRRSYQYNNLQPYAQQTDVFQPRNLQAQSSDNSFYSKLGREIATMIRNIDSKGERQINVEIERTSPQITPTILNANRYNPRSYWERSVRSPLLYFKEEYQYLNSKEKLLTLEKEVENAASRSSPLTLQELENILNTMTKAKFTTKENVAIRANKPWNNTSLNINLLPKNELSESNYIMLHNNKLQKVIPNYKKSLNSNNAPQSRIVDEKTNTTGSKDAHKTKFHKNLQPYNVSSEFWSADMIKLLPVHETDKIKSSNTFYIIKPTRKPITDLITASIIIPKRRHVEYLSYQNSVPQHPLLKLTHPKPTASKISNIQYHSKTLNYKTSNYVPSPDNQYLLENTHKVLPKQLASYTRVVNKPIQKPFRPSYFHHELHHFDYFE